MKPNEIIEGNKTIDIFNDSVLLKNGWNYSEMNYHSDWDNLMPVVEKIESLEHISATAMCSADKLALT